MQIITSSQNKIIKYAKSLQLKKYRDSTGEFLLEGVKLLQEAIAHDVFLSSIFYFDKALSIPDIQEIINICKNNGITVYELEEKPYLEISETKSSQGIIGIGRRKSCDIDLVLKKESYDMVILEEVQDPGNVGTIIRTADAFGFDLVILSKGCADIYSGKTLRSTMGSAFHIPIIVDADIESVLSTIHGYGVLTLAAAPHDGISCYDIAYRDKNAVIIGNESKGLTFSVMNMVNEKVNIPMIGRAESLNAGVAASVLMYEIMKYKQTR